MNKGRILVVEDDIDIAKMLRIYFDSQGYEVLVANRGRDALETCRRKLPNVVILDIQLPDIDGYEICRNLRSNIRTSYVPIIFLTQKDERSDKIAGLELGADDYITKPFYIEELELSIEGAIRRSKREVLTHPVTNLPAGKLAEEQLKQIKDSTESWRLLYFGIRNANAFKKAFGPIQVNDVLVFLADLMREAVESYGTPNDFIGQVSDDDFIIITSPEMADQICRPIVQRFNKDVRVFYDFRSKELGQLVYQDIDGETREADFMKLAVGVVSSEDGPFADILQITEDAAEARRRGHGCDRSEGSALRTPTKTQIRANKSPIMDGPSSLPKATHPQISTNPPPTEAKTDPNKNLHQALEIRSKAKKKSVIGSSPEELLDELAQLKSIAALAANMPTALLSNALFATNSFTSGKIHDISPIGNLLELAIDPDEPVAAIETLIAYQKLCLITYENLNDLRFKVLGFKGSQSTLLHEAVDEIVTLLPNLTLKTEKEAPPQTLAVPMPKLKLQQAMYNVYKWLLLGNEAATMTIRTTTDDQFAWVNFETSADVSRPLEESIETTLSKEAAPFIVYSYLAQKAMTRYGGYVKSTARQISLKLPLFGQTNSILPTQDNNSLQAEIDSYRNNLQVWESSPFSSDSETRSHARDLIHVVAKDLLSRIEAMLDALKANSDIDIDDRSSPWSAVYRKLRFFQILTMDLRTDYQRRPSPIHLKTLLDDVNLLLSHRITKKHTVIVESDISQPILNDDPMRLLQIFVNLGLNALEAMPSGGLLTFHIKQKEKCYVVDVTDNGRGISPENLKQIFDFGFSTKDPAKHSGRGIGLYTVKTYVEKFDGELNVSSELGIGTTFTVTLPIR